MKSFLFVQLFAYLIICLNDIYRMSQCWHSTFSISIIFSNFTQKTFTTAYTCVYFALFRSLYHSLSFSFSQLQLIWLCNGNLWCREDKSGRVTRGTRQSTLVARSNITRSIRIVWVRGITRKDVACREILEFLCL